MSKIENPYTVEIIKDLLKEAKKHKLEPLRYASTKVVTITDGIFKGLKTVPEGTKPRKNGAFKCYLFATPYGGYTIEPEIIDDKSKSK